MVIDRKTLAPVGFAPKPPRSSGSYVDMHPTRYYWRSDVASVVRKVYEKFGWDKIHLNTYVGHPPGYNRDTTSFDVWGPGGRGDPLDPVLGKRIFTFLFDDPNPPDIDWTIYQGRMWSDGGGAEPSPAGPPDSDPEHRKHIHETYTGKQAPKDEAPIPDVGRGVDDKALVALIDKHLNGMGRVIVDEAKRADLHVDLAAALVEQESGGYNIFGADYGDVGDRPPFYRQPVTQARVQALRTGGSYRHGMNGVGLTQLTWWEFVEKAEKLGGAHLSAIQCRVGFTDLVSMLDHEGFGYLEALGAYNAGRGNYQIGIDNGYAGSVAAKHRVWKQRISSLPKPTKPVEPPPAPVDPIPRIEALERRVAALERPVPLPSFVELPANQPVEEIPMERDPANHVPENPEEYTANKAFVGALITFLSGLVSVLAVWGATGEFNVEEFAVLMVAFSGPLAAWIGVYLTRNRPKRDPNTRA